MANTRAPALPRHPHSTCPIWIGYLLASPLRRLFEDPNELVLPLVRPGARVLELGPGLGYFTLPLADMLRNPRSVVCIDVQANMLERLGKRLEKRSLAAYVERRQCALDDLGIGHESDSYDLALAIHVIHETPSPEATLRALVTCLKPGGSLLLAEPRGHCPDELWQKELRCVAAAGLVRIPHPKREGRGQLSLWRKPECPNSA